MVLREGQQGSGEQGRGMGRSDGAGSSARPGTGAETGKAENGVGARRETDKRAGSPGPRGRKPPDPCVDGPNKGSCSGRSRVPCAKILLAGWWGLLPRGPPDSMPMFVRFLVGYFSKRYGDGIFRQSPTSTRPLAKGTPAAAATRVPRRWNLPEAPPPGPLAGAEGSEALVGCGLQG